jgi:NAD+ synthase (glutamine-hydrolysing)
MYRSNADFAGMGFLMRIGLGQIDACLGDLGGNADKIRRIYAEAVGQEVDLLVFPELALSGYPPLDLLNSSDFLEDVQRTLEHLAADCSEITTIVGFPENANGNIFNSAAVLRDGFVKAVYRKARLPCLGVFDEQKYFGCGSEPLVINVKGLNIAVTICRDIWDIDWLSTFFKDASRFEVIVNIAASPFHTGKFIQRQQIAADCAKRFSCCLCYCNLVGGQDGLVFDGRSFICNPDGVIVGGAKAFEEDFFTADIVPQKNAAAVNLLQPTRQEAVDVIDEIYRALVLGTKDYCLKNGFTNALVGLSGGIDSSVVAAIAAAALGPKQVSGITMPSKFNSKQTIKDAESVAKNLGISFLAVPIEPVLEQFDKILQAARGWNDRGVAYENLQARIRCTILMSLSNQFGFLVLSSGNKSEAATGYTTLYGDAAGGLAVIGDVPKTVVYRLAKHINKINNKQIIPASVIERAPSAELRPGQKDSDALPDYDLLDKILAGLVEEEQSVKLLVKSGLPREAVNGVVDMMHRSEFKRRQSPPAIKITPKAFGADLKLPITNRYRFSKEKQ